MGFYFSLLYFVGNVLKACFFLMSYRKGMDPYWRGGGEELRGAEAGETVIRVYYMRKESSFYIRRN